MDTKVQRAILHEHLLYYKRVFPGRDRAYRRFKSQVIIPRIHRALQKIDDGTYHLCDDCGEVIPDDRLKSIPGALRCVSCQTHNENT